MWDNTPNLESIVSIGRQTVMKHVFLFPKLYIQVSCLEQKQTTLWLRQSSKREKGKGKRRWKERGEGRKEEGKEKEKMVDQMKRRMSHPKANGNLRL